MPADEAGSHGFDAVDAVVGLARRLRNAGVAAGPERVHATISALTVLEPGSRADVYWAGRLTLCGSPDDIAKYDEVFAEFFSDRLLAATPPRPRTPEPKRRRPQIQESADVESEDGDEASAAMAFASRIERLRHRDLATLTGAERTALARLLATFQIAGEVRRTRRLAPAGRGRIDRQRTTHRILRSGGEMATPALRARRVQPRRVVLLVDVSGSMANYADALLRFAYAASRRHPAPTTEVFTIGTRLTRVTREISQRDPDRALAAASAAVADWSGGTRLGELLKQFLDVWGQRGMARGAVVVVLSDGWERGDASLLGAQVSRLHRLAHRVIWANPRAGHAGYEPLVAGMAAALPYVDELVSGHSLASLEHLATVVSGARRRLQHA